MTITSTPHPPQQETPEPTPVPTIGRGRPYYGVGTGIAILDSDIPRPVGDVGNARSFGYPVRYEVVAGIGPADMFRPRSTAVADGFVAAVNTMADQGIQVAATSCGLLAHYQSEVAARTRIPVAMSSLIQLPLVLRMLRPEQSVLLVTIDAHAIGDRHFEQSGVAQSDRDRIVVQDMADAPYFLSVIKGRQDDYEPARAEIEVLAAVRAGLARAPQCGAIVLECTNLPPFSQTIRRTTHLPVWDVLTLTDWLAGATAVD
ncbi:hypothetical protein [Bifidobacterium sp. SO1]|uniref:hypothetical protein n=1 Tax=Bifidobacterium sp. SO1 TaxID=2809029 RepID=UPI001BDC012F|nr:hypothetical protein [Bifidobacterium sp. SO1]MBT1161128.1 hypothetical protein [Bifidobacterium sp. SO1]